MEDSKTREEIGDSALKAVNEAGLLLEGGIRQVRVPAFHEADWSPEDGEYDGPFARIVTVKVIGGQFVVVAGIEEEPDDE